MNPCNLMQHHDDRTRSNISVYLNYRLLVLPETSLKNGTTNTTLDPLDGDTRRSIVERFDNYPNLAKLKFTRRKIESSKNHQGRDDEVGGRGKKRKRKI